MQSFAWNTFVVVVAAAAAAAFVAIWPFVAAAEDPMEAFQVHLPLEVGAVEEKEDAEMALSSSHVEKVSAEKVQLMVECCSVWNRCFQEECSAWSENVAGAWQQMVCLRYYFEPVADVHIYPADQVDHTADQDFHPHLKIEQSAKLVSGARLCYKPDLPIIENLIEGVNESWYI